MLKSSKEKTKRSEFECGVSGRFVAVSIANFRSIANFQFLPTTIPTTIPRRSLQEFDRNRPKNLAIEFYSVVYRWRSIFLGICGIGATWLDDVWLPDGSRDEILSADWAAAPCSSSQRQWCVHWLDARAKISGKWTHLHTLASVGLNRWCNMDLGENGLRNPVSHASFTGFVTAWPQTHYIVTRNDSHSGRNAELVRPRASHLSELNPYRVEISIGRIRRHLNVETSSDPSDRPSLDDAPDPTHRDWVPKKIGDDSLDIGLCLCQISRWLAIIFPVKKIGKKWKCVALGAALPESFQKRPTLIDCCGNYSGAGRLKKTSPANLNIDKHLWRISLESEKILTAKIMIENRKFVTRQTPPPATAIDAIFGW